jgi:hypothetical protein
LEILCVGGRPFIQDHQIDSQLLHPPIFVGEEYLVNDLQITGFIDADQNDRQVAGDSVRPKHRRRAATPREHLGGWSQCRVHKQYSISESLEEVCFAGADSEMPELNLSLSPSQCGSAIERRGVAMLVHEIKHFVA